MNVESMDFLFSHGWAVLEELAGLGRDESVDLYAEWLENYSEREGYDFEEMPAHRRRVEHHVHFYMGLAAWKYAEGDIRREEALDPDFARDEILEGELVGYPTFLLNESSQT